MLAHLFAHCEHAVVIFFESQSCIGLATLVRMGEEREEERREEKSGKKMCANSHAMRHMLLSLLSLLSLSVVVVVVIVVNVVQS